MAMYPPSMPTRPDTPTMLAPGSLQTSEMNAGDIELSPHMILMGVVLTATAVDPLTENPCSRYRGRLAPYLTFVVPAVTPVYSRAIPAAVVFVETNHGVLR